MLPNDASRRLRWVLAAPLLSLFLAGCGSSGRLTHENLNAVLWAQYSGEYHAVATQAYNVAMTRLNEALNDPFWTAALEQKGNFSNLPPAVILDVDETVLDNTAYEVARIRTGTFYGPETWDPWVNEAKGVPVPGSLEFCRYADSKGVKVFYVTNRRQHLRDGTYQNLLALGYPLADGIESVHCRTDERDKGKRREAIAREYRVLLLVGDNLGDFVSGTTSDTATRNRLAEEHGANWGRKWIALPNPAYGDWEGALYDYEYSLPDKKKLEIKRKALKD